MHITVFGAAGNVGSRVVSEALGRDHHVTSVVRDASRFSGLDPDSRHRVGDAGNAEDVAKLGASQDVVITATRPSAGHERDLVVATKGLLAGLAGSSVRLLAVGGAGSLTVPRSGGRTAIDDPRYVPPAAQPIARACTDQYEMYLADTEVDWTYASPAASLQPGERTGGYRLGLDELVIDPDGGSAISMEDFAVALIDEAERPRHHRRRFTVGY